MTRDDRKKPLRITRAGKVAVYLSDAELEARLEAREYPEAKAYLALLEERLAIAQSGESSGRHP